MEAITAWVKARLSELSTLDGTVILGISVAAFVASPFIKYIAVAGALYGAWRIFQADRA